MKVQRTLKADVRYSFSRPVAPPRTAEGVVHWCANAVGREWAVPSAINGELHEREAARARALAELQTTTVRALRAKVRKDSRR